MQYMTKLLVLALFVAVSFAACLPACAQIGFPALAAPPLNAWGVPIAYGNFGNGIVTTSTWSGGVGSSLATDSFANNLAVPFDGFGGFGCSPCGLGGFGFGPFQSAFGSNVGTQASQASGFSQSTTFGPQPIGLAFGIPVPGPGGLVYGC